MPVPPGAKYRVKTIKTKSGRTVKIRLAIHKGKVIETKKL